MGMRLVLFCDYGLDDAQATADALRHARADGYEGVDLVAIAGNVPCAVSLRNAKKLAAALGAEAGFVRIVDTTAYPQPEEFLQTIHGGDGMGDILPDQDYAGEVITFDAWRGEEMDFDLLSLGPMTLVPYALEKQPARFVFMGGNVREVPNYHGYEFNHGMDRAAYSRCVLHPHVAVTMDTCRNPHFNIQEREIAGEGLQFAFARRARELTFTSGEKGCYVWDDIAVKALRHPDWFALTSEVDRDGNKLTVARYLGEEDYLTIIEK